MINLTEQSVVLKNQQNQSALSPFVLSQDLFNRWVSFIEAKPRTVEEYGKALRYFRNWITANNIRNPKREDVIKYRNELQKTHKPTTVKGYITAIKLFFQWTADEGLYPNIADHVKTGKLTSGFKRDYLTSQQISKMLRTVDTRDLKGLRDYAILALMVTSGLRTVEVVRASIEDLRVLGDCTVLYVQGKGRDEKAEFVKVVSQVEDAIRAYLKARGEKNPKAPLFASTSHNNCGGRMTTRAIRSVGKGALLNAGFNSDRMSCHSYRHAAGTLNLLNGGTLEETRQLLRHKSINTTMIYNHSLERMRNRSEERIAKAIFEQVTQ